MTWHVVLNSQVHKALHKIPKKDALRIIKWTEDIEADVIRPLNGKVKKLRKHIAAYRIRIGNYRIFFDIYKKELVVYVMEVKRRTSTTYKK